MKLAIILFAGLNGDGVNTFAKQASIASNDKLTIKVFAYDKSTYKDYHARHDSKFIMFNDYKQLEEQLKSYDALITLTPPLAGSQDNFQSYLELIRAFPGVKMYATLDRSLRSVKKYTRSPESLREYNAVMTFASKGSNVFKYLKQFTAVVSFDFQFYTYKMRHIPLEKKRNVISYFGRFANFKGWNKIVQYFHKLEGSKYKFSIEGGLFKESNGKLSSTIGILQTICKNKKTKELLDCVELHYTYDEYYKDMAKNKANLYPIANHKMFLKHMAYNKFAFFPIKYDSRLNNGSFKNGIEYVWLEAISMGTPLIVTEEFGREFILQGKPLIKHNCGFIFIKDMSEVDAKCREYESGYEKKVAIMQNFWYNIYNNNNKINNILKAFYLVKTKENKWHG